MYIYVCKIYKIMEGGKKNTHIHTYIYKNMYKMYIYVYIGKIYKMTDGGKKNSWI